MGNEKTIQRKWKDERHKFEEDISTHTYDKGIASYIYILWINKTNSIEKVAKTWTDSLHERKLAWMANKYIKKTPTSLVTGKLQTEMTISYHSTP